MKNLWEPQETGNFLQQISRKNENSAIIWVVLTLFPYTMLQPKRFVEMILNISQKQTKILMD